MILTDKWAAPASADHCISGVFLFQIGEFGKKLGTAFLACVLLIASFSLRKSATFQRAIFERHCSSFRMAAVCAFG